MREGAGRDKPPRLAAALGERLAYLPRASVTREASLAASLKAISERPQEAASPHSHVPPALTATTTPAQSPPAATTEEEEEEGDVGR